MRGPGVADSQAAVVAALNKSGNPDVTIRLLPNAGHGLQTVSGKAACITCMKELHATGRMPAIELIRTMNPR